MDQRPNANFARPLAFSSRSTDGSPLAFRLVRTGIWSACYFAFYFIQQLAELFAPLLLIAGVLWKVLPALVGALSHAAVAADPQAKDAITNVAAAIPQHILVAGHDLTAGGLIWDGILLMGLAAAGATLATLAGRNL